MLGKHFSLVNYWDFKTNKNNEYDTIWIMKINAYKKIFLCYTLEFLNKMNKLDINIMKLIVRKKFRNV
jgi:hypothetical protein